MAAESHKILIIEDERQISRFLQLELTHEGYEVCAEYDGNDGLESVKKNKFDLILLDVMLPGLNGMEVCRRIREFSDINIIMLTAKDQIIDKVRGLDIGADDYVTKPFSIEELLARIRVNLRRKSENKVEHKKLLVADLILDISTHQVIRGEKEILLSKKEFDLIEYMMKNSEIVLTRDQILENVWGYDYQGDTNIVDVYIKYCRAKIDDGIDKKLIHTVRGVGYVLKESKDERQI